MTNHSTIMTYGNGEVMPEGISHGLEKIIPLDSSSRILASSELEFQLEQNDSTSLNQKEVVTPVLKDVGTERTLFEPEVSSQLKVVEPLQQLESTDSIAKLLSQKLFSTDDLVNLATDRKTAVEGDVVDTKASISHFPYGCGCPCCGVSSSSNKTALVTPEDEPTGTTNPIKALVYPDESKWTRTFPGDDTTFITYSFMTGEDTNLDDGFDVVAMDVNQRIQTLAALEAWEDVANIDFQFDPTGNGDIFFGTADLIKYKNNPKVTGLASGNPGDRVFVWLDNNYGPDDNPTNQNPTPSTDGFRTLLHEIGHALGLKHPGNESPDDEPPFLDAALDDNLYTVMSYNVNGLSNQSYRPLTPMVLDVAAIQYLYGANDVTRSGNNGYFWDTDHFAATIWDNGGIDSILLNFDVASSKIDLGETNGSGGSPIEPDFGLPITRSKIGHSDLVIPNGVIIENVSGGNGSDTISGNAVSNLFDGSGDDDELNGRGENDSLFGGLGFDTLDGGVGDDLLHGGQNDDIYIVDSPGDVVVEEDSDINTGGLDKVQSSISYTLGDRIEDLTLIGEAVINGTGNSLDNYIIGNDKFNVLIGEVGEDTLEGLDGDDVLDGGADNDILIGGSLNETSGSDRLEGGSGNDILNPGRGNDTLDGGAGIDKLIASGDFFIFDLRDTFLRIDDTPGHTLETDTLANIETAEFTGGEGTNHLYAHFYTKGSVSLFGLGGQDTLLGGTGRDKLDGGTGNDALSGRDGNDSLNGGIGSDLLGGNAGNDILVGGDAANDIFAFDSTTAFNPATMGRDRIEDFGNGPDYIALYKTAFSSLKSNAGQGFTVFGFSEESEFAVVAGDAQVAASRALIVYSKATGNLFYNQNSSAAELGSGGLFATLVNSPELTAGDFIITV
jgi:Ca2+-binding RTX toxin-like protein